MINLNIQLCCADESNRVEIRRIHPNEKAPPGVGDLVIRECKVCKRKHHEANLERGTLLAKPKG